MFCKKEFDINHCERDKSGYPIVAYAGNIHFNVLRGWRYPKGVTYFYLILFVIFFSATIVVALFPAIFNSFCLIILVILSILIFLEALTLHFTCIIAVKDAQIDAILKDNLFPESELQKEREQNKIKNAIRAKSDELETYVKKFMEFTNNNQEDSGEAKICAQKIRDINAEIKTLKTDPNYSESRRWKW